MKGSILRKLDAISGHDQAQKLAAGWREDENGSLIPPGWVRNDPPYPEG